jgi:hypothetical protein
MTDGESAAAAAGSAKKQTDTSQEQAEAGTKGPNRTVAEAQTGLHNRAATEDPAAAMADGEAT